MFAWKIELDYGLFKNNNNINKIPASNKLILLAKSREQVIKKLWLYINKFGIELRNDYYSIIRNLYIDYIKEYYKSDDDLMGLIGNEYSFNKIIKILINNNHKWIENYISKKYVVNYGGLKLNKKGADVMLNYIFIKKYNTEDIKLSTKKKILYMI